MRWYTLPGWPARVNGHSAATPVLVRPPASAWEYKDGTIGQPGTVAAPVPGPGVPTGPVAQAQGGSSYTAYCPGFYPNLYYARPELGYWPGAGMPISYQSDNLMPVPATDPRSVAAPLAVPVTMRGNQQIRQPANLVQWPGFRGGV